MRCLHHRGHVWLTGVPPWRAAKTLDRKLLRSVAVFPERAHLVGAYSLGKAQRVMALIRAAGIRQADLSARRVGEDDAVLRKPRHRRLANCGLRQRRLRSRTGWRYCHATAVVVDRICGRGAFPDPVTAFASGWMRVRARARQHGIELPLVISDHADWDGLTATIAATGASRSVGDAWRGGGAGALVHHAAAAGAAAATRSAMATRRVRMMPVRAARPGRHPEPTAA